MKSRARAGQLFAIVASLVICAVIVDLTRGRAVGRLRKLKDDTDVYALPPPEYLERASLGYQDAVASVLWASVLYQYGMHVGQNRRFPFATQYLRTLLYLVPTFKPAYRYGSTFVTMQPVMPSREEIVITRALLEHGLDELPSDPDVWGAYASFMMFEGPMFLEEKDKSSWRVKGAIAAERAVELGYVADNLGIAGAVLLVKAGHRDLAISQLQRAYAIAPDDETRASILHRLDALEGRAAREEIERTIKVFIG
ncbi:MAG: hypothetical protein ACHREM_21325, partial [Polyangiales bacterium]